MAEGNNREHFNNFISVAVALKITIFGLQDYVLETLKTIHRDVYRKCAMYPKCSVNCSRKHKNRFGSWCDSCKIWKNELHKLNSYNSHWDKIRWEKLDTVDFPLKFEEMSKVFIRDFQSVRQGYLLQDINSLMSLFKNLKTLKVNINDRIIDGVLRVRNENFGHNYQLRLFEPEKRQSIRCLRDLLGVTEIVCTESAKCSIMDLTEIELNATVPIRILQKYSLENIKDIQDDYVGRIEVYQNVDIKVETFNRVMHALELSDDSYLQETTERIPKPTTVTCIFGLLLFFTFITVKNVIYPDSTRSENTKPEGCMSMRFDEYWRSDLDFNFYVEDLNNQSVIERKWLQDLLIRKIKISTRGIILTAGMGYGKSSLISNLICAEQGSALHELRQSVLAYHMCRYDVKFSIKPEVFIRNLAGQLVKYIPEVGNTILSDDRTLDFLHSMKCAEDPTSCAEFSLFYPLKNLPNDKNYLIVIDALDECDTTGTYNLLTLIYRKMNLFPRNIKFVFTTRNIEQLVHKFKELERINLQSFELLNANDLRTYIKQSQNLNEQHIDKLTEDSSGNFLYVKLKLQYCEEIGIESCDDIPESLERIYSLNFERVFGEKGELFDDFIQLFEVLCSLQDPIEEGKLFRIAGFGTDDMARKASKIIGNELGHFIKFSRGRISFQHKSLSDFLTNSSRKHLPFYVNKQNGHKLFSSYLLESLNLTRNDNLVEIAHHVALTGEPEYEEMFMVYALDLEKERIDRNYTYLYEAAREVNDYHTVQMLIRLVTSDSSYNMENATLYNDLSSSKKMNMSVAAFIAAASGNDRCVRAFLDYGASTNYTYDSEYDVYHAPLNALYICKYELFCGYNYMHIAAQRGHSKVVQYLLNKTPYLLHLPNRFNITAFQLAAEHGHVSVMKVMLQSNKTLADQHSLHHAAENGHLMAVNILMRYVEDTCLLCNWSVYWRHFSTNEYQHSTNHSSEYKLRTQKKQDTFFDDKRLLACETALHAATRNGHFEIVSVLVKKSKAALNCELFDGSIPLMTAVMFNRSDIFNFLYQLGGNKSHICTGIVAEKLNTSKLFPSEVDSLVKSTCPRNGNIAHLIAMHDNIETIQILLDKHSTLLNTPDADGSTPLHYAFCHNSYNFIKTFLFEKSASLNLTVRANNGSTPFHSAAICKSPILHRYFKGRDGRNFNAIPDSLDNLNRTILQYGLSVPVDDEDLIRIDRVGRDEFTYQLFEVTLRSNHNFRNTDAYDRNFLHSAAQSGNYWAFILILHNSHFFSENDLTLLLFQKDNNGRIPLEVAFDYLPGRKSFEPIKIPQDCVLNNFFF